MRPPAAAGATGGTVRRGSWLLRSWRWLAAGALCLVVVWAGLLPPQVGGATSYVITQGVSMLPHFHAGDLVVLRKEATYHVGEVAAYHNKTLHEVVMHRIVAVHGDRYVFKGDNNSFEDSYEPTKAQIVGAEWVHLPRVGNLVLKLREPLIAAIALGLLWIFSFSPRARSRRQRRRRRRAT